jgi:hypothetical protein
MKIGQVEKKLSLALSLRPFFDGLCMIVVW